MTRFRIAALAACALLSATAAARAGVSQVTIDHFAFTPAEITVSPGTTVTWINRDDIPHTITDAADPKVFKSAPLDTGDTFSHVFAEPGTYRYFCSLHAHMQGTIVVR
jgi:plastocyanin